MVLIRIWDDLIRSASKYLLENYLTFLFQLIRDICAIDTGMGVKIFRKLKLQMNGMFYKLQVRKKSDEGQSEQQVCSGYSQIMNDSRESNEDVFDENNEMLSFESTKDQSFDFRARASFRALLFRTYTLTRSNRRIRRDSSCCEPMNMSFIGQIYRKADTKKVKRSLSTGSGSARQRST